MEYGEKLLLDAKEVTEWRPKLERKNRYPVTYDGVQEAMMLYYHLHNYFC